MPKKILLADVDGVLLNWAANLPFYAFDNDLDRTEINRMVIDQRYRRCVEVFGVKDHKTAHEYMIDYHRSHYGRIMPAYTDAVEVLNRLKLTYDFIAVTAFGTDQWLVNNRVHNLDMLFPDTFIDCYCVDGSKLDAFYKIDGVYSDRVIGFVDDREDYLKEYRQVFGHNNTTTYQLCRGEQEHHHGLHVDLHVSDWYEIEKHIRDNY